MFELTIEIYKIEEEEEKKNTVWPKKTKSLEIPLRKCSSSGLLMSLQKNVQLERKWKQNADCVKLFANFRQQLIIPSDAEYPFYFNDTSAKVCVIQNATKWGFSWEMHTVITYITWTHVDLWVFFLSPAVSHLHLLVLGCFFLMKQHQTRYIAKLLQHLFFLTAVGLRS